MKKRRWAPVIQQHVALVERRKNEAIREAQRKIQAIRAAEAEDVAAVTNAADEAIAEIRQHGSIMIVAGEWYLAVDCDTCHWPIPLYRDALKGKGPRGSGSGVLRLTCRHPDCGQQADYPAGRVVSLQALEEGPLPGPRQQE
jgi:hypothetical protein